MAVAFDAAASVEGSGVVTLTTPAFTIAAGSNMAGALGLSMNGNNSTGFSGSIGGTAGSLVANTDSGTAQTSRTLIYSVIAPPSGSRTATMSWTTSHTAMLGAVTVSGCDQTTPMNNGTFATAASGNPSVTITSNNGDLTLDTVEGSNNFVSAPTQTQRWLGSTLCGGGGSTGPGTGTTTHGWTTSGTDWSSSGANFVQVAAAAVSGPPIMGSMLMVNP